MAITDPIADMLTRIRNASRMKFKEVDVMPSRVNVDIAKVLKANGYISGYEKKVNEKTKRPMLRISLRYLDAKKSVVTNLERVSRPSRRIYVSSADIPKVFNGFGMAIISTSKGIMTDREARSLHVGGELLFKVW